MEKNSKYSFIINKEVKDKFKMYCKIMKVSPSDLLCEVIENFNRDVDKVIQMKEIGELQAMIQGKFTQVEQEIDLIKAKKN